MGDEHLCGRPERVPTFPSITSAEGCPLVAETARTALSGSAPHSLGGLGQLSPLTSLGYSFIFWKMKELRETVCPQASCS